jgi:transposase-like protein
MGCAALPSGAWTSRFPYLIRDARSEKVREAGSIVSQAVQIAVAVDGEGRRQILAVELANRESRSSWRDFLAGMKQRGLHGVEFIVSDDDEGHARSCRGFRMTAPSRPIREHWGRRPKAFREGTRGM